MKIGNFLLRCGVSVGLLLLLLDGASSFLTWPECDNGVDLMDCPVPVCPDCDLVDCFPRLEPEECPEGSFFRENMAFGGCCPACVTYMDRGGWWIPTDPFAISEPQD